MPEATGSALVASLQRAAEAQAKVEAAAVESAAQARLDRQAPPPLAAEVPAGPAKPPVDREVR